MRIVDFLNALAGIHVTVAENVNLPIFENDEVGYLKITTKHGLTFKYKVYSCGNVKKTNFFNVLLENLILFIA